MKILITTAILALSASFALGQKADTIFVNTSRTSYVICADTIPYFEIGSKQYTGTVKDNAFFIKPLFANTDPTSLLIKSGNNYINMVVAYSNANKKAFYDFTAIKQGGKEITDNSVVSAGGNAQPKKEINKAPEKKKAEVKSIAVRQEEVVGDNAPTDTVISVNKEELDAQLNAFMQIVSPYKTVTIENKRILLSLGNIKITDNKLLLKISIANYSQHRFIIDKTEIFYLNQAGDLLGSQTELQSPLDILDKTQTVPYTDLRGVNSYGFLLDAAGLKGKGKLIIRVTERSTGRELNLEIPSSLINKG